MKTNPSFLIVIVMVLCCSNCKKQEKPFIENSENNSSGNYQANSLIEYEFNSKLIIDTLFVSSGGGIDGNFVNFKLVGSNLELRRGFLNYIFISPIGLVHSFSYSGQIPAKLNREIYNILKTCKLEVLKEEYPIYTHAPVSNIKIHFNGANINTKGNDFPQEIHNLLSRLYKIERSELY